LKNNPSMPNVTVDPTTGICSPDPVRLKQNQGANVPIVFQFAPGTARNWSWSGTNPIVVEAAPGLFAGGSQSNPTGKGAITVTDRNAATDLGTYKYRITVRQDDWPDGMFLTIDPQIVNEA
jgi:hypothetical protein